MLTLGLHLGLGQSAAASGGGFGPELVTNGGFADGTGWTVGSSTTISGGKVNVTGDGNFLFQNVAFVSGHTYRLTFDYTCTSGANIRFDNGVLGNGNIKGGPTALNTDGASHTLSYDFTATQAGLSLEADAALFTGTIDNVSAKEIL